MLEFLPLYWPTCVLAIKLWISFFLFIKIVYPITKVVFVHCVATRFLSERSKLKSHGSWAVVTGATDGIGLAYCQNLAKDGLNIFLISRNTEKLQTVASNLENKYHIKTKIFAADFIQTHMYSAIAAQLQDLDVCILVNNVGLSFPPCKLYQEDLQNCAKYINCNAYSAVAMSRIVLHSCSTLRAIVNIASATGALVYPFLSLYSGSKVFLDFFSRGLHAELKARKILVQSVLPYYVVTKMSGLQQSGLFSPMPEPFVNSALNLLGVEDRTFGCLAHSIQHVFVCLMPEKFRMFLSSMILTKILKKMGNAQ